MLLVDVLNRDDAGLGVEGVDDRLDQDQVDAAVEQAWCRCATKALLDGGVDLLLLETIFDTLNAKAAIAAILEEFAARGVEVPLMISVTVTDRSGRTLSGQTIDAFFVSIRHARPFSIGLNCALGAADMRPYLAELSRIADTYVTCYPNAGLPNAFGQYDELPQDTARLLREFAESGFVNVLGGCCGTTPTYSRHRRGGGGWRHGKCKARIPKPKSQTERSEPSERSERSESSEPSERFSNCRPRDLTIRPSRTSS